MAGIGKYVLMCDDTEARMVQVQPVRNLSISHQVDLSYPWCMFL